MDIIERKNLEPFLRGNLPLIIDGMAKRYGKLPSEILNAGLNDFNLDLAIYYKAMLKEQEEYKEQSAGIKPTIKGNKLIASDFQLEKKIKKDK